MDAKYITVSEECTEYIIWCLNKIWNMPVRKDEERNTHNG